MRRGAGKRRKETGTRRVLVESGLVARSTPADSLQLRRATAADQLNPAVGHQDQLWYHPMCFFLTVFCLVCRRSYIYDRRGIGGQRNVKRYMKLQIVGHCCR